MYNIGTNTPDVSVDKYASLYNAVTAVATLCACHDATDKKWSTYSKVASLSAGSQTWILEEMWTHLLPHFDKFNEVIIATFSDVTTRSFKQLRPYLTEISPNIFSPLHLIAQSIAMAHVLSRPASNINVDYI